MIEGWLSPEEWTAVRLSLLVSVVATGASLPFGVGVAYLLARGRFPGKAVLDALVHLPLILPPVVTGYLLLISFGKRGPIGAFLDEQFGIVFSFRWTGAALAVAVGAACGTGAGSGTGVGTGARSAVAAAAATASAWASASGAGAAAAAMVSRRFLRMSVLLLSVGVSRWLVLTTTVAASSRRVIGRNYVFARRPPPT